VEGGLKVCDVETRHKSYSLEKYVERLKFVCHKKKQFDPFLCLSFHSPLNTKKMYEKYGIS
jgi:hypothetical protein